jgi:hypothetical protein
MLLLCELPVPELLAQPARAMAAAIAAAEMVKVFFMEIRVLKSISGASGRLSLTAVTAAPVTGEG